MLHEASLGFLELYFFFPLLFKSAIQPANSNSRLELTTFGYYYHYSLANLFNINLSIFAPSLSTISN